MANLYRLASKSSIDLFLLNVALLVNDLKWARQSFSMAQANNQLKRPLAVDKRSFQQ